MKNKILLLIIVLLFLNACYASNSAYKARQEIIKQSSDKMRTFCSTNVDDEQAWLVSNIFFSDFKSSLTPADKEVLLKVVKLHQVCTKVILIIAHTSNFEAQKGVEAMTNLSYLRAKAVKEYLIQNNISSSYPKIYFCGNNNNRVFEDSKTASSYNQRVEIVFIKKADMINNQSDLCLIS